MQTPREISENRAMHGIAVAVLTDDDAGQMDGEFLGGFLVLEFHYGQRRRKCAFLALAKD